MDMNEMKSKMHQDADMAQDVASQMDQMPTAMAGNDQSMLQDGMQEMEDGLNKIKRGMNM